MTYYFDQDNNPISQEKFFHLNDNQYEHPNGWCQAKTERGIRCSRLGNDGPVAGLTFCPQHLGSIVYDLESIRERSFLSLIELLVDEKVREQSQYSYIPERRARNTVGGVVYYLKLLDGIDDYPDTDIIKIGTSTSLKTRLQTHKRKFGAVELLATEPGDSDRETERHYQFRHLRLGKQEFFRVAPDLLSHIELITNREATP